MSPLLVAVALLLSEADVDPVVPRQWPPHLPGPFFAEVTQNPCDSDADERRFAGPVTAGPLGVSVTIGASSLDDRHCELTRLIWRHGDRWVTLDDAGFAPRSTVRIEHMGPSDDGSVAIVGFARRTPIELGPDADCGDVGMKPTPGASLVIRYVEIVRPLAHALELVRIVTGIAIERDGKTVERWERSVHVSSDGLELRAATGRLAWFRDVGRFTWAELPAVLARSARIVAPYTGGKQMIDAVLDCERTGKLELFLEGLLEPIIMNMPDLWRRVPRTGEVR